MQEKVHGGSPVQGKPLPGNARQLSLLRGESDSPDQPLQGSFSLVGYIGHNQYNIRKIINNGSKTYVKLIQRPYL